VSLRSVWAIERPYLKKNSRSRRERRRKRLLSVIQEDTQRGLTRKQP
jgi:hypothetical protein